MTNVNCCFSIDDAKTIVRIIDHVTHQAENSTDSKLGIDKLCRKDSAQRWRVLRNYIETQINVAAPPPKTAE